MKRELKPIRITHEIKDYVIRKSYENKERQFRLGMYDRKTEKTTFGEWTRYESHVDFHIDNPSHPELYRYFKEFKNDRLCKK